MATNADNGGDSNGTLSRNFPSREYDALKHQIEKTNNELSSSRRRCDLALSDLDYYREQHRAVMNQLEVSSQDSASLRTKYAELLNENKQLQAENQRLCKELTERNGNASESLFMSHSQALSKLEIAQDENSRLLKQCELLSQERAQAQRDVVGFKQQLVKICKEYAKYREAHQKLQQQYDEAVNVTIKANKDIKRLTDERNATTAEYTLVMSERDTVHKEMEKLSDDLAQSLKKIHLLDVANKELQEEKRNLTYQLESLRREISSALHERDKAIKDGNDLREKFGEFSATSEKGMLMLGDQTKISRGRLIDSLGTLGDGQGCKEHLRENVHSINQRRLDNLDQANQELENLRKSLDKAQTELAEAVQEAEVSKGRRDWAFSERDKIVLERESIRTLCDNMRKERDRAVSELAESLRESDAVKKQRNELVKEAKALREAIEMHLEKSSGLEYLQEYSRLHTEVVELELTAADEEGLEFATGRELSGDGYVYVASVASGSSAEGKLFQNDRILKVNDIDCSQGSLRMVTEAIRSSMPLARVLVKRNRCRNDVTNDQVTKWIHTARLVPGCHGLSLKIGVYINRISEGSLAARDKSLTVGDRVLRINDKSMDDIESAEEAMEILNGDSSDVINITTLKMSYPECPNVFTPVRRHKKENRSSQTEDWLLQDFKEKNNSGAWLKEKLEMMRGPWRHSKEDKKKYRNSSPNPIDYGHEQAIAELDLVLDSYHPGTVKRSAATKKHFSQTKEEKNNGGTWPKARAAPILTPNGGTVVTRTKERPPLSLLAPKNNQLQENYNYRNSTPVPLSLVPPIPIQPNYARHSVYKSVDNSHHFGMVADSFERLRVGNNNRLSANVNSDNSLDFSVHRFVDKEVMTYCKKNTRTGVPKYGSDSERESIQPESNHSHSRGHSQLFISPRFHYPYQPHHIPHLNQSKESFSFEPFHHIHSPSADVATSRRQPDLLESGGTFPRKNQRFRVPSNPSVTSKVSTGSIERGSSERGSPMPSFLVEVLSSPGDHSGASTHKEYCPWAHKPLPGELRRVHIDKSNEPLGIQINCPEAGGIFVSTVSENSLASRVGLQIGDQLLEVCGINMRNATYNLAANVLRQCGNSITMLVQYSPEKYHELGESRNCSDCASESEEEDDEEIDNEATPCNSPKEVRKSSLLQLKPSQLMVIQRQAQNNTNNGNSRNSSEEPRYLCIETLKTSNLGISLVGGNAAGIFIHSVQPDSLAYHAGLRTGDQILEYNGSDLRAATAEEAAYELAKPADKVTVLAHYRIDKYNEIKDKPGDSLYVRCGFDRSGNEMTEPPQFSFSKDEVLYVDNTMFNGVPGQWRAWKLDAEGHRQQCGIIPSKYKVEEELLLRRGAGDPSESRSTATARRSFFRRKKHQRGSSGSSGLGTSRDSKELASFCNLSPGWYSDSGSLHEDLSQSSYQRVERLQYPEFRPVIVLGPLAECVADKLVQDFPDKFTRASTESRRCSQAQLDRELAEGLILEYRRRGSTYECITISAVRSVAQTRLHCMLDGSITMVERLHRHHIYPVVLLIKFKSTKQIREVKDARYSIDKLSGKAAKEMFEHGQKLELEYRHLVTAVVSAGANVAHICAQVKVAVDAEHRKSQWVPTAAGH
ncbi:disks large homolog 5 [Diorhabda carinulata]|uniref:disks large homolog 5 n=1 Tax=Diorhabda carinulata TaxID=1163345 RepID=UPI0025A2639A|nr:disks large homolog 5 [Diorhabda carinulata]XP_057658286.1 disks large homolog 5 [Diorhabda carinulata]